MSSTHSNPQPQYKGVVIYINHSKKFFRVRSHSLTILYKKFKGSDREYPEEGTVSILFDCWKGKKSIHELQKGDIILFQDIYTEPGKKDPLHKLFRANTARHWRRTDKEYFGIDTKQKEITVPPKVIKKSLGARLSGKVVKLKDCLKKKIQRLRGKSK